MHAKKLLALALALVLALSLVACGGNPPAAVDNGSPVPAQAEPAQPAPEAPAPAETEAQAPAEGGQAMSSLISWMKSGTFSYDFDMTSEGGGQKTQASGSMAMDGNNIAITTETTAEGQKIKAKIIIKDGTTYIIDDMSKTILIMANAGAEMTGGIASDYSDIALVGSGTGEINGKTLPYEEYASEGVTIKYYLEGGQVYGTESEYEGYKTVMIITNPSNKIPAGAFDLPAGYTEMKI
ncbi:MAG: hypothetical protein LBN26_00755 [Christensenellaceae bacterium]|jgi:hypothetical protein|nr:hypothetical protein [Christensenellaceae bacterium]